jgi:hypothetical protein
MVDGSAQFALDGSVFFVGEPTLAMQFSHLHQHLVAPFRRILTIAKPGSYPDNQPGRNGQKHKQTKPSYPTGLK